MKYSSLIPSLALLSLSVTLVFSIGCSGAHLPLKTSPESQQSRSRAQEGISRLYVVEGERSAPMSCETLDDDTKRGLLTRYFAHTQGSKAIVKEHCESQELSPLPELERGSCQAAQCWSHDTYRRGPTYFARFLAALEASIPRAQVEVEVLGSEVTTEGGQGAGQTARTALSSRLGGLFALTEHRVVHKQRIKFHLDEHTRCVAQLKTFRDILAKERTDRARTAKRLDLSPRLSLGDIWAEHRRTADGYEVMILERHLAEGRGEGEVLEVEMLCVNPQAPINPHHAFYFSAQEINRDTLRVFASPK